MASVKLPGHGSSETIAGVSTNGSLAAAHDSPEGLVPDSPEDEKPSPPDATLEESEHILVDYLSLLPRTSVATAVQ